LNLKRGKVRGFSAHGLKESAGPADKKTSSRRAATALVNVMATYITEINKLGDLNVALQSFSTTCAANAVALGGLTPAQLTEISGMATNFTSSLNSYATAKAAADLALSNRNAQVKTSKATLSKWAKTFRANPTITDALLDQLDLPHHKTPGSKTPPVTPGNLIASSDVQGLVSLKWKRNGNTSTTVFTIETQTALDGDWSIAGSTTKTKFDYQAVLGNYIAFRVFASRDGQNSQPTVPVTLWANGGGQSLTLKAA